MQEKKIWARVGDVVALKNEYGNRTGILWYKWQDGCGTKDLAATILVSWDEHTASFFVGKNRVSIVRTYNFIPKRYYAVQFVRTGTQADLPVSIEELLLDPDPLVQVGAKRLLKMWDRQERLKNQAIPKEQL